MGSAFVIVAVLLSGLVVVAIVVGLVAEIRGDRRWRAEFDARVVALGWRPVDPGAVRPWMRSPMRRTRLALVDPDGRWYVWQRSSTAFGGRAVDTITLSVPVALGAPAPPFEVVRRTVLGARLASGVGTGDPAFDRVMLVRSSAANAAAALGRRLRTALAAGDLPPFRHVDGNVYVERRGKPSVASMIEQVESVQAIAAMLPDPA